MFAGLWGGWHLHPGTAGVVSGERGLAVEDREHPAPPDDQVLLDDRKDRCHDPVDETGRQA